MRVVNFAVFVMAFLLTGFSVGSPTITYISGTNEVGASTFGGETKHHVDNGVIGGGWGVSAGITGSAFAEGYYEYSPSAFGCTGQDTHVQVSGTYCPNGPSAGSVAFETVFTVNEQCAAHIEFGINGGYIGGGGSNIGFFGRLYDLTAASTLYDYTEGGIYASGVLEMHYVPQVVVLYPGHTYKWVSQWSLSANYDTWIDNTMCSVWLSSL